MALGNYLGCEVAMSLNYNWFVPWLIVRKIELQGQGSISYIFIFTPIYLGKISSLLIL